MNSRIVRKRQYHVDNNEVVELSALRCKEQPVYAFVETLMPHAIQIRQTGGPQVLNGTPIEVGEPGSGLVRRRQGGGSELSMLITARDTTRSRFPIIPSLESARPVEVITIRQKPSRMSRTHRWPIDYQNS